MASRRRPVAAATSGRAPAARAPGAADGGPVDGRDGGKAALSEPVEVLFLHATRPGEELRLMVSPDLTMGQVRRELVQAVGRKNSKDLNVRLASKDGNTFSYYHDSQLLGKARELIVLGLTLSGGIDESQKKRLSELGYARVPVTVWVDGGEASVVLSVQETATLGQVKELLAEHLQRPEVLSEGHFVPMDDEGVRLPEHEPLRGRWRLKLAGLEPQAPPLPGAAAFEQPVDVHEQQKESVAALRKEEHEALLTLLPGLAWINGNNGSVPQLAQDQPAKRWTKGEPQHASFCRCPLCKRTQSPEQRGPLEMLGDYLPSEAALEWPLGDGGLPLVTALIATHHGRLTVLRDAVASVLGQSYQPIEIVVVVQNVPLQADAEHLSAVRSEAFARLPMVRVVPATEQPDGLTWTDEWGVGDRHSDEHKAHRAAFVRNAGLAAARGEYVAFLDDDDVWLPGKLGMMIEEMRTRESGFAASDAYCGPLKKLRPFWPQKHSQGIDSSHFILHNSEKHRPMLRQRVREFDPETRCCVTEDMLRRHNLLITSTVVLSRELLTKLGYMNTEVRWEDYDYWVRAIELEGEVLYLPEALAVYDEEHGSRGR